MGNLKFARFVLLPVSEEAKTWLHFFFFVCIQNNKGRGKAYQPNAEADNPYRDLDYSGYHENLIQ